MYDEPDGDLERAVLDGISSVGDEVELLVHPGVLVEVVGLRHPASRVLRAPHRDPRQRALRVVLAHHVVAAQVEAVVGVQVGEEDGVDGRGVGVPLEGAQGAVAEVQQHAPGAAAVLLLEEVAAGGGLRPGVGPGASDDRHSHLGSRDFRGR